MKRREKGGGDKQCDVHCVCETKKGALGSGTYRPMKDHTSAPDINTKSH